jgi:hypothetical protein
MEITLAVTGVYELGFLKCKDTKNLFLVYKVNPVYAAWPFVYHCDRNLTVQARETSRVMCRSLAGVSMCQFHQNFTCSFFSAKVSCETFFGFMLFWRKKIGRKAAFIMLMTLNTVFPECQIVCLWYFLIVFRVDIFQKILHKFFLSIGFLSKHLYLADHSKQMLETPEGQSEDIVKRNSQ